MAQKTDTVDTHENQFIKYALTSKRWPNPVIHRPPQKKQAYLVFDISADQVESELRRDNWNAFKVKAKSAAPTMTPYSDLIPKDGGLTIVTGNII